MKTTKILALLLMPAILGFLLASCGGSGGKSSRIPNGRQYFKIGDFVIQNPFNGEDEVCLQPDIEVVVPYNSGLCRNGSDLGRYIRLRPVDDAEYVELLPTITFRQSSGSNSCVVETRPVSALVPEADYYISVDKDGGGQFVFRPGSAAEFTTTSESGNQTCRNAFRITDSDWQATDILNFGQYDPVDDEIIFDGEDLQNVFFDMVASAGMSLFFETSPPDTLRIKFNTAVDPVGLNSYVRIYEFDLERQSGSPTGFRFFDQRRIRDCERELDAGPQGQCIYVNPNNNREIIVTHPSPGWPQGYYLIFVMDRLQARNGKVLNSSYFKILR